MSFKSSEGELQKIDKNKESKHTDNTMKLADIWAEIQVGLTVRRLAQEAILSLTLACSHCMN